MKKSAMAISQGWVFLSMGLPLAMVLAAWQWLFLPGLSRTMQLKKEQQQLSANVYESSWLDSTQARLTAELIQSQKKLSHAKSRLLPRRPFQQTLDSLRHSAAQTGIEILETQVATSRSDSLRTMLLRVHARGDYSGYWKWLKQLELNQPWWSVQEMVLKPVNEGRSSLDGAFVFAATGPQEVLP